MLPVFMLSGHMALAGCSADRVQLKMANGVAAFTVAVMDTFNARAKGMMFRKSLPKFSGMLFMYKRPQSISFWMRNTLIPLDMIFLDQTGTVIKIHANAIPLDETPIFGGDTVLAVLEINGGLAEDLRIKPGAILQHPAFDPEIAAWPCNN